MIIEWYRELFLFLWKWMGFFGGIVGISVIVSLACFPIYNVIGRIVGMENSLQSALNPAIAKIRETYADAADRQSAIERLYARFGYHPIMGVRKVLPLFVSIPFLMLTYYMLAGTTELEGVKWLCFNDLSKPDGMIFGINVLPFVMTGINLLTVYATPCFNKKDEAQAWVIAIFFLVILYTANTALMIYWTLNQFFNFLRSLYIDHWKGAKSLVYRICSLRYLPQAILDWFTADRLRWLSLALMLVSVYMWLMVHMQVWFFNCYISRALICPTILMAMAVSALAERHARGCFSVATFCSFAFSSVLSIVLLGAEFAAVVSPGLVQWFYAIFVHVKVYYWILGGWTVVCVLGTLRARGVRARLGPAFVAESHWLLLPIVLALHYSFSSALVKLPVDSVFMLMAKLVIPAAGMGVALTLMFAKKLPIEKVCRVGIVFVAAAYLVPMISLESGKVLAYYNNLVVRCVFMGLIILASLRFSARKPLIVFFAILLLMAGLNAAYQSFSIHEERLSREQETGSEAEAAFRVAQAVRTNNVYLLVYDSYAHDQVLAELKIPSRLHEILLPRGFTRYDAYSVGSDTVASMGNSFAIGGVTQGSGRSMMVGNNPLCDLLKRSGYKTSYVLSAYDMPGRGERMPGDFYFPAPQKVARLENVLLNCILSGYLSQAANTFNSYTHDEWEAVKSDLLKAAEGSNSFVYVHNELPGHAIANAAYRKSEKEEIEAFARRLVAADKEIESDVDEILRKNDDSLIIVASDHGAFLKLCDRGDYGRLDLLDRCGIQLYVRWPKGYKPALRISCLTDVFLETFICLSGDVSLARFQTEGISLPVQAPLKAPYGAIRKGIIQSGRDAGQSLFGHKETR